MNSYDSRYMSLKEEKLKEIINKRKTVVGVANDLNVSRQTVHKWLSRYQRFGLDGLIERKRTGCKKAPNRTSAEVEQLVINVSHQYFADGVETLHDRLEHEYNLTLHPTTIYRILSETTSDTPTHTPEPRNVGRSNSMLIKHQDWNCRWIRSILTDTNKAKLSIPS